MLLEIEYTYKPIVLSCVNIVDFQNMYKTIFSKKGISQTPPSLSYPD